MSQHVIALDQGTTSSRAIIFDVNGKVVSLSQHPFAQIYPQPGWVEHDPMTINRIPRKTGFLPLVMAFTHSFFFFGINKRRLTRARTSDSQPFRCFLPFCPWRATARLRPKEQKSLENPRLSDAKQFCRSRNARRQGKARREYFVYSQGL